VIAFDPRQRVTTLERAKASRSRTISTLTKVERDGLSRSSQVSA
jgi:hypothetical protein